MSWKGCCLLFQRNSETGSYYRERASERESERERERERSVWQSGNFFTVKFLLCSIKSLRAKPVRGKASNPQSLREWMKEPQACLRGSNQRGFSNATGTTNPCAPYLGPTLPVLFCFANVTSNPSFWPWLPHPPAFLNVFHLRSE